MVADELKKTIAGVEMKLEHPEREEWGDYAVFMKPGKEAEETIVKLEKLDFVESVTRVGGFINIRLKQEVLVELMVKAAWLPAVGKGKTVVVEYSSPNIAKAFGIGHLRSTIIGQALYNIYKKLGYKTVGDNHVGDWGTQFGKLLYMIDREKVTTLSIDRLEKLYVEFHKHPEWEEEGQRWFKKLEEGDERARKVWQKCVDVSMAEFERIYKLLGVEIDNAYGESFYKGEVKEVMAEAREKGIVDESEGALVVEVEGQKTPLMLLKSDGVTTYATRDLATVRFRMRTWNPEVIIYEVGAEQALHFIQVFSVAKKLQYVSDRTVLIHTKHGLYLAPDGKKFSTREGKTVKLEEVLGEAVERAKKLGSEDEATAKAVGIGAVKYFDLAHGVASDIVFDWEKMMALEGNSGPYVQYTYARTQSVLKKAESLEFGVDSCELNLEELRVVRWIYRFAEVVEEAAGRYSPNLVCNFIYELAQRYNSFYNKHSILEAESEEKRNFRLAMTAAVGEVLKEGLELLGIAALERM